MDKTKPRLDIRTTGSGSPYTTMLPGLPAQAPYSRTSALRSLTGGRRVVYAMRMPDGAVKIGTTVDLANRLSGLHAELLGFIFGSHEDERALHRKLAPDCVRGREYYRPSPAVMAAINAMRDDWNLPHLAA